MSTEGATATASLAIGGRYFKYSGRVGPLDPFHQVTSPSAAGGEFATQIAPTMVAATINYPPPTHYINVPRYAAEVRDLAKGYNPSKDCSGYFTSSQFQVNNNCYAYGTDIASNTFPQPGRASGTAIGSSTLNGPFVESAAQLDGLVPVGKTIADIQAFDQKKTQPGHYVALMISPADSSVDWPGDYHWARCDDPVNFASWSQKDGGDQVTNFDFVGKPITDPSTANWAVNQGPLKAGSKNDIIIGYDFYSFMFVPHASGAVRIL